MAEVAILLLLSLTAFTPEPWRSFGGMTLHTAPVGWWLVEGKGGPETDVLQSPSGIKPTPQPATPSSPSPTQRKPTKEPSGPKKP